MKTYFSRFLKLSGLILMLCRTSSAQNYPDPFNPDPTITFYNPGEENIKIDVFKVQGELVKKLVNGYYSKGEHSVKLKFQNLTSGIYFYQLKSSSQIITKKMLLIK